MYEMKKAFGALLLAFVLTACGTQTGEENPVATPIVLSTLTSAPTDLPAAVGDESSNVEVEAPEPAHSAECLDPDVNKIGLGIADTFGVTIYEDVMAWFCNGNEFEDILLALQSEQQSDASAEEMLQMVDDGFTWDEIWLLVGITG